jgi:hypothetical protein
MKVGDRVVCVNAAKFGNRLKKGAIYVINSMQKCSCGAINFDVGLKSSQFIICEDCGTFFTHNGCWWVHHSLFAPISYNSAHDELLNKEIVEEKADIKIKEPQKA